MHEHDEDDDDEEGSTPEWAMRWTVFPVLAVKLIRDVLGAVTSFWDDLLTHVIAFHNRRTQQYRDMDEVRMEIESMTAEEKEEAADDDDDGSVGGGEGVDSG